MIRFLHMLQTLRDGIHFGSFDWWVAIPIFLLSVIGLAGIYSVDISGGGALRYFPTQAVAVLLGLLLFCAAGLSHESVFSSYARHAFVLALILLVGVLFFGVSVRGTTGWFRIAGFSFQPSEFAKVAVALVLPAVIADTGRRFYSWHFFFVMSLGAGLLSGLILLQPDLGSASVIVGMWFILLVAARIPWRLLFGIVGSGMCFVLLGWFFLFAPYQKDRIITFLDPARDPLGAGYNVQQSVVAIGAGGFFGRGLGSGTQSQLHFLPEAQTDFIFAVIGEELGLLGALSVLLLYGILIFRALFISGHAKTEFGAYAAIAVGAYFFIHLFLNVGAATGIVPVTGVTLSFVSYGGSAFIMSSVLAGVLVSISRSSTRPHYIEADA